MVDIGSASLRDLFLKAYSVARPDQVSGPDWMMSQRFDVQAKFPEGATKEQLPEMLQALLQERFKLAFHRTSKLEPGYALIVGPGGPKLQPAITGDLPTSQDEKAVRPSGGGFGGNSGTIGGKVGIGPNGKQRITSSNEVVHIEFFEIGARGLADYFAGPLGRPVIDMTELQGTYHVLLDLAQSDLLASSRTAIPAPAGEQIRDSPVAGDVPLGSVYAAIDKLGLKLQSRKVSVERFVIDHIEKLPTEN
jgi:uncharacterized protein (TIGR03435 family)